MNEYSIVHLKEGKIVITKYNAENPIEAIGNWQHDYFTLSAETIISITRTN